VYQLGGSGQLQQLVHKLEQSNGPEQSHLLESKPPRRLKPLGGVLDTLQHRLAVDGDHYDAGEPQAEWASVVFCASLTVRSISWVSMWQIINVGANS
jgi:hypothetical protein